MRLAVLLNEDAQNAYYWLKAASQEGINIESIDLLAGDWIDTIRTSRSELFLTCPSGITSVAKSLYDERLEIVARVLEKKIYPNLLETKLHENKRYLSYWLETKGIPHPKTWVFLHKDDALQFAANTSLPIVGKLTIGASGHNVVIFRSKSELQAYIKGAFHFGISPKSGPNLKMGDWKRRLAFILKNPSHVTKRFSHYKRIANDIQRGYVIFQIYVPHSFEWRVVRIGDSYFGHQKIKQGDKASGTKGINYVPPPVALLNFVRDLCEANDLRSMAVDLFEDGDGKYLVNEMQTIFGHVQDHICEVDGKPGRFKISNKTWDFEEGNFNGNLSYNLRLKDALKSFR